MTSTARNVLIILALAALIVALPGADSAAGLLVGILNVVFLGVLAWFASRLYREYRPQIYALGDQWRALLYFSIAVAVLTVSATPRLWDTGPGTLIWFTLIAGVSYAVYVTFRRYQRSW